MTTSNQQPWQNIETAPMGEWIRVLATFGIVFVALQDKECNQTVWIIKYLNGGNVIYLWDDPTHWMPLPAHPTTTQKNTHDPQEKGDL